MSTTIDPQDNDIAQRIAILDQLLKRMTDLFNEALHLQRRLELAEFTTMERATASTTLKSKVEDIEEKITEFREVSQEISLLDIVHVYMEAGWTWYEALDEARGQTEGWGNAMNKAEEEVAEMRQGLL